MSRGAAALVFSGKIPSVFKDIKNRVSQLLTSATDELLVKTRTVRICLTTPLSLEKK